jgi:hypothetical protein
MNKKTVNINIGGLFFHIDEDAYHQDILMLKRSLSNSSGDDHERYRNACCRIAYRKQKRTNTL